MIGKYTAEEARNLQAYGELPSTAKINQTAIDMAMDGGDGQEEDMGFDFDEVSYARLRIGCLGMICLGLC